MGATTDSEMLIKYDVDNKPGISNLMTIYSVLSNVSIDEVENKFKDSNYGTFKKAVADLVVETLKPIQEKYYKLLNSNDLDNVLNNGKMNTSIIAEKKYNELKNIVGLHR